jgi:4-amino-4-deoxy-L-arabinose transferase-like glycosyltransferase
MPFTILDKPSRWVLPFLIFLYAVRLLSIAHLQLAPDEAYYWYWSKHLDWSYFDHPPMTAYIMALFTALGTDSEIFVRLGGLLCTVGCLVFVYLAGRKVVPEKPRFPWEVLAIANVTLLFSTGSIIQTPDTPMLLFWAAALYFGVLIITEQKTFWWYLWGVALGLGLLSKYTAVLLIPCQFAYFLLSPSDRFWLARKEPYVALLIGAVIFFPVLFWNWQHQWVSFLYQSQHGFSPDQNHVGSKLLEYFGGQAVVITPGVFLLFVFYGIKGIGLAVRERMRRYLYLVLLSWPVLLFFAVSTAVGNVAEANWPAPAYVAGLLLMWGVYCRTSEKRKKSSRRLVCAALGLGFAIIGLVHIHLIRPIIPFPPDKDLTNQLHGWRDLGEQIDSLVEKYPHESGYFLVAERGTALAEAVFYSKKIETGINFTHPERYIFLGDTSRLKGRNALILLSTTDEWMLGKYRAHFDRLIPAGKHQLQYRGEVIEDYSFFIVLGEGYRGKWL